MPSFEFDDGIEAKGGGSLNALEDEVARRGSESLGFLVWLAQLARETGAASADDASVIGLPRTLGRFKLESLLGSGAYGAVFRATDMRLDRPVALKLAWPSVLVDPTSSQRFADEPRTMAAIDHRGIVEVYDSGAIDMVGFISMELIDGPTLAQWSKRETYISERVAAKTIQCIGEAIGFAHAKGIVHRDLKPSNVLLRSVHAGGKEFSFEPVVTDFGLARRSQASRATQMTVTRAVVGTDHYMSPEQAAGANRDVGPASDVFSLGVMLYELLAGWRPFDGESSQEIRGRIQNDDPPSLRGLRPGVSRDLETISQKCLEKSPQRRYSTAGELVDDLTRFLNHEPIQARRITVWRRGVKFAQRSPAVVVTAAVIFLGALTVAAIAGAWVEDRLTAAREVELAHTAAAVSDANERQHQYVAHIQHAASALHRGGRREVEELLAASQSLATKPVRRGIEWDLLSSQINDVDISLAAHSSHVHVVRFSASGDLLLSAGEDGRVVLWDTENWTKRSEWSPGVGEVNAADISADGSLVAIGGLDGRVVVQRVADQSVVFDRRIVTGRVFAITWLGEALRIAVGGECPVVSIIDPVAGSVRSTEEIVSLPGESGQPAAPAREISDVAYLPFLRAVAVVAAPHTYHLIDVESLGVLRSWREPKGTETIACASHGAGMIATSTHHEANPSIGDLARLTDGADGAEVARVVIPHDVVRLRFSRDSRVLMGAFRSGVVWTWNTAGIRAGAIPRGRCFHAHVGHAVTVDISPDNGWLASGGRDGRISLWHARPWGDSCDVQLGERPALTRFSPCGRWFAVVNAPSALHTDWQYAIFDANTGGLLWRKATTKPVFMYNLVSFSPTGDEALFLDADGSLCGHDPRTGSVTATYHPPMDVACADISYSTDGKCLVLARASLPRASDNPRIGLTENHELLFLDRQLDAIVRRYELIPSHCTGPIRTVLGDVCVQVTDGREIAFTETPASAPLLSLPGPPEMMTVMSVSPDGRYLAAAAEPGIVYSWDIKKPGHPRKYIGHEASVFQLSFARDHSRILSVSLDGTARLWCTATGAELLRMGTPDERVAAASLHPSGNLLVLTVEHAGRFGWRIHRMGPNRDSLPRTFDMTAID